MTKDKPDDPPFGRRDDQIDAIVAAQKSPYEIRVLDIPGAQKKQAESMREARRIKAASRNQKLDEAIVAVAKGEMAVSIKYAEVIRPRIMSWLKLNPDEEWPSARQIKERLSHINRPRLKDLSDPLIADT